MVYIKLARVYALRHEQNDTTMDVQIHVDKHHKTHKYIDISSKSNRINIVESNFHNKYGYQIILDDVMTEKFSSFDDNVCNSFVLVEETWVRNSDIMTVKPTI